MELDEPTHERDPPATSPSFKSLKLAAQEGGAGRRDAGTQAGQAASPARLAWLQEQSARQQEELARLGLAVRAGQPRRRSGARQSAAAWRGFAPAGAAETGDRPPPAASAGNSDSRGSRDTTGGSGGERERSSSSNGGGGGSLPSSSKPPRARAAHSDTSGSLDVRAPQPTDMCDRCGQDLSPGAARRVALGFELPTLHRSPDKAAGARAKAPKRKAAKQGGGSRRAAAGGRARSPPREEGTQTDAWLTLLGEPGAVDHLSPAHLAALAAHRSSAAASPVLHRSPASAALLRSGWAAAGGAPAAGAAAAAGQPAAEPMQGAAGAAAAAAAPQQQPAGNQQPLEGAADMQPPAAAAWGGGDAAHQAQAAAAVAAQVEGTPAIMAAAAAPPRVQAAAALARANEAVRAYDGTPAAAGAAPFLGPQQLPEGRVVRSLFMSPGTPALQDVAQIGASPAQGGAPTPLTCGGLVTPGSAARLRALAFTPGSSSRAEVGGERSFAAKLRAAAGTATGTPGSGVGGSGPVKALPAGAALPPAWTPGAAAGPGSGGHLSPSKAYSGGSVGGVLRQTPRVGAYGAAAGTSRFGLAAAEEGRDGATVPAAASLQGQPAEASAPGATGAAGQPEGAAGGDGGQAAGPHPVGAAGGSVGSTPIKRGPPSPTRLAALAALSPNAARLLAAARLGSPASLAVAVAAALAGGAPLAEARVPASPPPVVVAAAALAAAGPVPIPARFYPPSAREAVAEALGVGDEAPSVEAAGQEPPAAGAAHAPEGTAAAGLLTQLPPSMHRYAPPSVLRSVTNLQPLGLQPGPRSPAGAAGGKLQPVLSPTAPHGQAPPGGVAAGPEHGEGGARRSMPEMMRRFLQDS